MKFAEELARVRAERNTPQMVAQSDIPASPQPEPSVRPILAIYEAATSRADCKVFVTDGFFRDIDIDKLMPGMPVYKGDIRSARRYPIGMPLDANASPNGGTLYYAANVNGQWWAITPVATTCTTTTTTTRPPCTCSGPHPDMQVTIAGVTAIDPTATCQASICATENRTWCVYFVSGSSCIWTSNWIWPTGCSGQAAVFVTIYFPFGYAGAGDPCTYAVMTIEGGPQYECATFDPDTGGTFTPVAGQIAAPNYEFGYCKSWPTSLTVTASASCTTTTTTTTTSTSTTTTTTTTTTTSTTTAPPFCGTCSYQWNGTSWDFVSNSCTGGCACVAPVDTGTFIGQPRTTDCV